MLLLFLLLFALVSSALAPIVFHFGSYYSWCYYFSLSLLMLLMFLLLLLFTLTPSAFTFIVFHFCSYYSYSCCDSLSLLMHLIFTHGVFAFVVLGVFHSRSYS